MPAHLRPLLAQGRVMVTNWHIFALQDDTRRRGVIRRGAESDTAFCERVLADLDRTGPKAANILVLNDEAHHAYRSYAAESDLSARTSRSVPVSGLKALTASSAFEASAAASTCRPPRISSRVPAASRASPSTGSYPTSACLMLSSLAWSRFPRIPNWDNRGRT